MTFGEFKIKLKKEIDKLRDHCNICEENYKEEYEELEKERERKKRKRKIICKHFKQGKCAFGSDCFKIHENPQGDLREKIPRMFEN